MAATLMQVRYRRDRIPTRVYNDNYGFTINFYQPMIDYLDAKERGAKPQRPHLPWSNERALKKYWANNNVSSYSNRDIEKYSAEAYVNAKVRQRDLVDYKVIKRSSPLAVTKSALGARLEQKLKLPSVEEKYIRKQQERNDIRRVNGIMDNVEHIKTHLNTEKPKEPTVGFKQALRGKTASQIADILLRESDKNIKQSKNLQQDLISQVMSRSCVNRSSNVNLSTITSKHTSYKTRTVHSYRI